MDNKLRLFVITNFTCLCNEKYDHVVANYTVVCLIDRHHLTILPYLENGAAQFSNKCVYGTE